MKRFGLEMRRIFEEEGLLIERAPQDLMGMLDLGGVAGGAMMSMEGMEGAFVVDGGQDDVEMMQ